STRRGSRPTSANVIARPSTFRPYGRRCHATAPSSCRKCDGGWDRRPHPPAELRPITEEVERDRARVAAVVSARATEARDDVVGHDRRDALRPELAVGRIV